MEFNKDIPSVPTADLYYDLFDGGYFKPEKMLKHADDIEKVKAAIELVRTFLEEAIEQELIEEI